MNTLLVAKYNGKEVIVMQIAHTEKTGFRVCALDQEEGKLLDLHLNQLMEVEMIALDTELEEGGEDLGKETDKSLFTD